MVLPYKDDNDHSGVDFQIADSQMHIAIELLPASWHTNLIADHKFLPSNWQLNLLFFSAIFTEAISFYVGCKSHLISA